jgi:hypothetical protein
MPRRRKQQSLAEIALNLFRDLSSNDIKTLKDLLTCMVEPPEPSPELPCGPKRGGYFELKVITGRTYIYYRYRCEGVLKSLYVGKNLDDLPSGINGLGAMRRWLTPEPSKTSH